MQGEEVRLKMTEDVDRSLDKHPLLVAPGILGAASLFSAFGMACFGVIFFCCDKGHITSRTGSCNFFNLVVAPSIFTFLMAACAGTIGLLFVTIYGILYCYLKFRKN